MAREMASVGRQVGREIHLAIYPRSEWKRLLENSEVAPEIASSPMLILKGSLADD